MPINGFRPGEYGPALAWLGRASLLNEIQQLLGVPAAATPRAAGGRGGR